MNEENFAGQSKQNWKAKITKKKRRNYKHREFFLEKHQIYILRNAEMSKNLRANLGKFTFVVVCGSI